MSDDRHLRISERAHAIWERLGRPHGADQDHWHQAAREIDGEEAAGKSARMAKTAAPAKAPATRKPAPRAKPR